MKNIVAISLPSRIDIIIEMINNVVEQLSAKISLSKQELFDIRLVLEEAITNAIKHGNKSDPERKVKVIVMIDGRDLIILVRDQGEGFDFKNIPNPTKQDGLTKTSGRGVFLIRKLMDDVQYSDKGREIKMVKTLSQLKD